MRVQNRALYSNTAALLQYSPLSAGISNPAALVYLLMTDPDVTPEFGMDYVQQLRNGQWDIIGNQQQDSTYIASFLDRVQVCRHRGTRGNLGPSFFAIP
ncbi:hypothetical protein [Burkholderia vietnamiensis]|uniref:hypothetical protein n=1 Tax=Burkholderia vietnamiensis TaxID=60552 RepID=UPI001CAC9DBB|nr:hypothetical protein [Burkholderia vietnamiensis]CAG9234916.1 hypothetical protein BVI1335_990031 [Burkholderia vietnamiensis]